MIPPRIVRPNNNPSPAISLLAAMAVVAAGFFLVIKTGFIFHHDPQPSPFDNSLLTASAFLIVIVALAALAVRVGQYLRWQRIRSRIRRESAQTASLHAEARRLRVAELAADPRKAKYAPLVEHGEDWPDEHIEYFEDTERTAMCSHLHPIEQGMRRAGVETKRYREQDVSARCKINLPALQSRFNVNPPVRYSEYTEADRHPRDFLFAFLICDEHKCILYTVHPDENGAKDLPLFPTSATV